MKGPHRISMAPSLLLLLVLSSAEAFVPSAPWMATTCHASAGQQRLPSQSLFTCTSKKESQVTKKAISASALQMTSPSTTTIAAITGAITGGVFAGGLHAIAGPDHLAALLPRCVGQRWHRAGKVGALWGMGHGVSATIIGVLAFGLKNKLKNNMSSGLTQLLSGMSHITEIAVGLSLIVIGIMGIREAREWEDEIDGVKPQNLSSAVADSGVKSAQKRAVVFNGLLHGFSWDGAPSLAPAIAVATWTGNLAFLSAYALGTMGTMAIVTTLIGEGTRRAGQVFHRPDIPQKLSLFSSVLAIAIGGVWCGLAVM